MYYAHCAKNAYRCDKSNFIDEQCAGFHDINAGTATSAADEMFCDNFLERSNTRASVTVIQWLKHFAETNTGSVVIILRTR
jgi:hypothetical protein